MGSSRFRLFASPRFVGAGCADYHCRGMPETGLILTLAGGLGAALLGGYITQRLGLSPIVGYLWPVWSSVPYTPGLHRRRPPRRATRGGRRHPADVRRRPAVPPRRTAGRPARRHSRAPCCRASSRPDSARWRRTRSAGTWPAAIVFGLSLSVASTVVLDPRALGQPPASHQRRPHRGRLARRRGRLHGRRPRAAAGARRFAHRRGRSRPSLGDHACSRSSASALLAAVIGSRVIPVILDRVAATRSRELFTLTVLALALGLAVGAALVFGVSMALGAFLAGMIVGRSDYSLRAATDALPMRDAFAVLFFVSVGMLLRPAALLEQPGFVLAALFIVLVGKPADRGARHVADEVSAAHDADVSRCRWRRSASSRSCSSRIGRTLGVVPPEALDVVVATAIISITLNPLAFTGDRAARSRWLGQTPRRLGPNRPTRWTSAPPRHSIPASRAIVIGHGPTGRTVTRLLRENGISPTVVELNMNVVRELREQGVSAVYGDASHTDTLVSAGLPHAAHAHRQRRRHRIAGHHPVRARDQPDRRTSSCASSVSSRCAAAAQRRRRAGVCGRRRGRAGDDRSGAATSGRDAGSDRSRARARARRTDAASTSRLRRAGLAS